MKVTVCDLINNTATRFTEADRGWLSALHEDQLAAMVPIVPEPPKVNIESITFESLLAAAPPEVKSRFDFVDNMIKANRESLITRIKSNAAAKFTDDQLAAMGDDLLLATADTIAPVATYAAGAGAFTANAVTEEAMELPAYVDKK